MRHLSRLLRTLGLCLLLGASPVGRGADPAAADAPAVVAARVVQEVLPALDARLRTATARVEAGRRWFAGEASLGEAFVDLADAPLDSPGFVDGALADLDRRAVERAAWRVAAPPPGLSPDLARRWREARERVAEAEDQADALKRRFLAAVRAVLDRAPLLQASATADIRARWAAAMADLPPEGDPGRADALKKAAAAGQARAALERYLAAAWRVASIPGDPALDALVDADLAAAATEPTEALLDRLSRVRPLLDPERRAAVDAVLARAELERLRAAVPAAEAELEARRALLDRPPAPDVGIDVLQRRLAELDAALDGSPPPPGPSADAPEEERLRARLSQIERERQEVERALLRRQLEIARRDAAGMASAVQEEQARRRASEARAAAEQAQDDRTAKARSQLARFEEDLAGWIQAERDRHAAALQRITDLSDRLDGLAVNADEALGLPALEVGRQGAIDAAFRSASRLVVEVRRALADTHQRLSDLEATYAARRQAVPDPDQLGDDVALALADLAALHDQERGDLAAELDELVGLLRRTKHIRRRLRREASTAVTAEYRAMFIPELATELSEAPLLVRADLRATWRSVRSLPTRLTDLNLITNFLVHSFEIVVLGVLWILLRRNAEDMGRRLLDLLRRQQEADGGLAARHLSGSGWWVPGDVRALAEPMGPVLFAVVDASIAAFFFRMTRESLTPLALLFAAWLARTIWRGVPAVVRLLFSDVEGDRPALRVVSAQTLRLLERSARLVVGLMLARWFLGIVTLDLLGADRLADMVGVLYTLGIVAVTAWLLLRWSDEIRDAVRGFSSGGGLAARLAGLDGGPIQRMVGSAFGAAWLAWHGTAELVVRMAEGRPGLGWLASAFARVRLGKVEGQPAERRPIPSEVRDALARSFVPVPRDTELAVLDAALEAWNVERRRGMLAVVADRGMGRGAVIDCAVERVRELDPEREVRRIALAGRTHDPDRALAWLARSLGLPDVGVSEEGVVEGILGLPPSVLVVDDLQRLALRTVGGFRAMHGILRVMQATSERHLWICGVHGATWGFLAGITSSVNLGAFRGAIKLSGLSPTALRGWVKRRIEAAGYRLCFDALLPTDIALPARDQAIARAEVAWWRLLVDASRGNPEIAWTFVLDSLCCASDARSVSAAMLRAPPPSVLEPLPDLDFFVLTAIVVHDELDTDAIAEVLNAPLSQIQEACRHLEGLDVLQGGRVEHGWRIDPRWWPAVVRVLRQKHFLYME